MHYLCNIILQFLYSGEVNLPIRPARLVDALTYRVNQMKKAKHFYISWFEFNLVSTCFISRCL